MCPLQIVRQVYFSFRHHLIGLFSDSTQYTDGITGALIVHPTNPPPDFPTWDEELVIQVSDWYHDMSESLLVDYFSVRLTWLSPSLFTHSSPPQPEGITGYQGTEPVPDAAVSKSLKCYQ